MADAIRFCSLVDTCCFVVPALLIPPCGLTNTDEVTIAVIAWTLQLICCRWWNNRHPIMSPDNESGSLVSASPSTEQAWLAGSKNTLLSTAHIELGFSITVGWFPLCWLASQAEQWPTSLSVCIVFAILCTRSLLVFSALNSSIALGMTSSRNSERNADV